MSKKVPDAWDDDYEAVADTKPDPTPAQVAKSTRAERKAQHAASQRALWDTAENQNSLPFFLHAGSTEPPLKTNHKGQVQVLTRKPKDAAKPVLARRSQNGAAGLENRIEVMSVAQRPDEEEELDSEDEARLEQERMMKQRQEQAHVERAEKARKYEEARRRIFGQTDGASDQPSGSSSASPNGRARGGGRGGRGSSRGSSRPTSASQSPARIATPQNQRQLFDPEYTSRPAFTSGSRGPLQTQVDAQIIRQPRGPDQSGFGFASRGGKSSIT